MKRNAYIARKIFAISTAALLLIASFYSIFKYFSE